MLACAGLAFLSTTHCIVAEALNRDRAGYLMVSNAVSFIVWLIWLVCTPFLRPVQPAFSEIMLAAYPILL
jgi:hypothetical protein